MLQDVPVIPVTEGVDWYQYNTENITGWVTAAGPVRAAGGVRSARLEVMLLHLKPK